MNDKQKKIAITTLAGAVSAEAVIGGLGIGVLGTAFAFPASLVAVTVGTVAFFAASGEEPDVESVVSTVTETPSDTAAMQTFLLKKGTVTHKISVNKERGWGQTCLQAASNASWTNYRYFCDIQEMRDLYKTLLSKGYQPA